MNLKRNKQQLEGLVLDLAWNDRFGCYSRPGFEKVIWPEIADEAEWIIFLDVDDMHTLNQMHGYDGVDAKIKQSLTVRATDYVACQWQSGDEFIICLTQNKGRAVSDPQGMCERLIDTFLENGVPATFAVARVTSKDLAVNVRPAAELVRVEKAANHRGRINFVK
jgi:hypothetical protein